MKRKGRLLVLVAGLVVIVGAGAAVLGWRGGPSFAVSASPTGSPTGSPTAAATSLPPSGSTAAAAVRTSAPTPLTTTPAPGELEPGPGAPVATDPPARTSGGAVSVSVTYSGWDDGSSSVQVSGLVLGTLDRDGVCTVSLTRGGVTVTQAQAAQPDVSSTSCGTLSVPGSRLSAGDWRAVLSYRSSSSSGSSGPVTVTVPAR